MSGFEWDSEIDNARMKPGKMTQVYNYCVDELIPGLDKRRDWARYIRLLNPDLPEILKPEIPTEHVFQYIARRFVLRYQDKKDLWRLCYLGAAKGPPGGNSAGDGTPGDQSGGDDPQGHARYLPPDEDGAGEVAARAAALLSALRATCARYVRIVAETQLHPRLRRARRTLRNLAWAGRDALDRFVEYAVGVGAALHLRRAKVAASLTSLVREMNEAVVNAPRKVAALKPKRLRLGGIDFDFYELAPEQFDWSAWWSGWPFGRMEEELAFE